MTASSLPPGVVDSMLPGNTPDDLEFEAYLERWATMVNSEYGVYEEYSETWDEWASQAFGKGLLTDAEMLRAIRGYEDEAIEFMRLLK